MLLRILQEKNVCPLYCRLLLIYSLIFFLQILNMPTLTSEMPYFSIIALLWQSDFTIISQLYGGNLYSMENCHACSLVGNSLALFIVS